MWTCRALWRASTDPPYALASVSCQPPAQGQWAPVCEVLRAGLSLWAEERRPEKGPEQSKQVGEQGHRFMGGLGPASAPALCPGLSWTRFQSLLQFLSISGLSPGCGVLEKKMSITPTPSQTPLPSPGLNFLTCNMRKQDKMAYGSQLRCWEGLWSHSSARTPVSLDALPHPGPCCC